MNPLNFLYTEAAIVRFSVCHTYSVCDTYEVYYVTNTDPAPKKTLAADADDNADHYVTRSHWKPLSLPPCVTTRIIWG